MSSASRNDVNSDVSNASTIRSSSRNRRNTADLSECLTLVRSRLFPLTDLMTFTLKIQPQSVAPSELKR